MRSDKRYVRYIKSDVACRAASALPQYSKLMKASEDRHRVQRKGAPAIGGRVDRAEGRVHPELRHDRTFRHPVVEVLPSPVAGGVAHAPKHAPPLRSSVVYPSAMGLFHIENF